MFGPNVEKHEIRLNFKYHFNSKGRKRREAIKFFTSAAGDLWLFSSNATTNIAFDKLNLCCSLLYNKDILGGAILLKLLNARELLISKDYDFQKKKYRRTIYIYILIKEKTNRL